MNVDEKECPYCAEVIKARAIRCKHCQSEISQDIAEIVDLDVQEFETEASSNEEKRCPKCYALLNSDASACECGLKLSNTSAQSNKPNDDRQISIEYLLPTPNVDYELGLIGIPIIGIILLVFWIDGLSLIEGVSQNLRLVGLFVVIGTALVASLETQANASVTEEKMISPLARLLLILIFWVYFFPEYLNDRKKYGLNGRLGIGVLLVIIFTGLAIYMEHEVNSKKEEIFNQIKGFQQELDNYNNEYLK